MKALMTDGIIAWALVTSVATSLVLLRASTTGATTYGMLMKWTCFLVGLRIALLALFLHRTAYPVLTTTSGLAAILWSLAFIWLAHRRRQQLAPIPVE